MKKLITKFIYFLLKYADEEIVSIEDFKLELSKIAKGKFHTVQVEISQHSNTEEMTYEFIAYVDSKNHTMGNTPKKALDDMKVLLSNKVKVVEKVLD